jgi:ATP-dependent protease ClpP protease subunit
MDGLNQILKLGGDNSFSKPLSNMHEFYLTGEIETPENYVDWFDRIRHAGENDVVRIYINSPGGNLTTAIQFMRVLTDCQATVMVSVEGACMSAATMIMLCADSFEISPHSMFMFHNYSGGTIGKGGEMYDNIVFERKWSEQLLREIYADFLTDEEVESMLNNKDLWLDGEEVLTRLKAKVAKLESQAETVEEGQEEEEYQITEEQLELFEDEQ